MKHMRSFRAQSGLSQSSVRATVGALSELMFYSTFIETHEKEYLIKEDLLIDGAFRVSDGPGTTLML